MELQRLVEEMKNNPISLFYGSGITLSCGGISWHNLFSAIKQRYPDSKEEDFFKYLQEVIGYDDKNRKEIEDYIQKLLAPISPDKNLKYLYSIPWRSIFTTNWDQIPEMIGKTLDKKRDILPIKDLSQDFNQYNKNLYCFKLMGDMNINYPNQGSMVLTESGLFNTAEYRSKIFNFFKNISTTGIIIYIGHSFDDNLVYNLINHMKSVIKKYPYRSYLIKREDISPSDLKKLNQIGVEVVKGSFDEFIKLLKEQYGDEPVSAEINISTIRIHGIAYDLDRETLTNIFNKFKLLDNDCTIARNVDISSFLLGETESFYPYLVNWDYPRKTTCEKNPNSNVTIPNNLNDFILRKKVEDIDENSINAIIGTGGSGKTVAINRLAYNWYISGNPVIFIDEKTTKIEYNTLDGLMDEIRDKYLILCENRGITNIQPIRWLIIGDVTGLHDELLKLKIHLKSRGKPADIFYITRNSECSKGKLIRLGYDSIIHLEDSLTEEEIGDVYSYYKGYRSLIDEEIWKYNSSDKSINESFLGLMYSTIKQVKMSIDKIIEDEYNKLDEDSKILYRNTAFLQTFDLLPLKSIIIRTNNFDANWIENEIISGRLSGLIKLFEQRNIKVYNRILADKICKIAFKDTDIKIKLIDKIIADITLEDIAETDFLDILLNSKIDNDIGHKFSDYEKIHLFISAIKKIKTKPLLIHLGRIQTHRELFPEALETLKEAHSVRDKMYDVPIQHVYDAEGRVYLEDASSRLKKGDLNVYDLLTQAESKFLDAQIDPKNTFPPYNGITETDILKARIAEDRYEKLLYLFSAIRTCYRVESYLGDNHIMDIKKDEIKEILHTINFNENDIERLNNNEVISVAYAYLAQIEFEGKKYIRAKEYVEKGLKYNENLVWLMRLSINIYKKEQPQNTFKILEILKNYEKISSAIFDIDLSFELAKEKYMAGELEEAKTIFRKLRYSAQHHPRYLKPRNPEDRWIEDETPRILTGIIREAPSAKRYGWVETIHPQGLNDRMVIRFQDLETGTYRSGTRVYYEVMFNMLGPQASRVRLAQA